MNSSSFFTKDEVISEVSCERNNACDIDQRAFKSGTIRSFARAALVAPFVSESIQSLLEASAKGAANNCEGSGEDVACRLTWSDTKDSKWKLASASNGNLGEVANALSAVKALLWSDAKPIANANGTASSGSSSTGSGSPSGTSGATNPETTTSSAGTIAVSFASILAVAFAATLSL
jgi:mannan endo-1,6-alpha-mannosidase